ncbi:hypothetical protein HPP92_021932, partial [Vanilla planifolia]
NIYWTLDWQQLEHAKGKNKLLLDWKRLFEIAFKPMDKEHKKDAKMVNEIEAYGALMFGKALSNEVWY